MADTPVGSAAAVAARSSPAAADRPAPEPGGGGSAPADRLVVTVMGGVGLETRLPGETRAEAKRRLRTEQQRQRRGRDA